jgi:hypothetical protein
MEKFTHNTPPRGEYFKTAEAGVLTKLSLFSPVTPQSLVKIYFIYSTTHLLIPLSVFLKLQLHICKST